MLLGLYPLRIPSDNNIFDFSENVHFRLLKFGMFGPKKMKSSKLLKHTLKQSMLTVGTKYLDLSPHRFQNLLH